MRPAVRKGLSVALLASIVLAAGTASFAAGAEKWRGVDETVVERFAKEQGREAREPVIDTDKGDLLLFLFLAAGAVGGFAAGYYWRTLVERRETGTGKDEHASS